MKTLLKVFFLVSIIFATLPALAQANVGTENKEALNPAQQDEPPTFTPSVSTGSPVTRAAGAGLGYAAGGTVALASMFTGAYIGLACWGGCDETTLTAVLVMTVLVGPAVAVAAGTALGARLGGHSWSKAFIVGGVALGVTALGFGTTLGLLLYVPEPSDFILIGGLMASAAVGLAAATVTSFALDTSIKDEVE